MAIGSGLSSSFGFSLESAYGTYTAPSKFVRHKSASLQKTATRVQGDGIISSTYGEYLNQFVETTTGGMATVGFDIQSKNMGLLFQTLMGTTVTPVQQSSSSAYLQTHALADPFGKSLTMQVGLPQRGGTVTPATLKGCKVSKIDLSCGIDTVLSATATIDAQAYENSTSLATPSYTSNVNVFHGGQLTVKLGTYGSEAAVTGVKNVAVGIERAMDTAGYYAGATVAGTKSEPVLNGVAKVSGSITVDFTSATDFHNRVRDNSSTAMVLTWVGPLIASTYYETFTVTIPAVVFPAPTSFDIADRGVLSNQFAFEARYDGANPSTGANALATVSIISAESAL